MHWTQVYTPVAGSIALSALAAALPVIVLLGLLAVGNARAHWAALAGLGTSLAVALLLFQMPPLLGATAALYGAAYGLFPIGWIVLCAIFMYDVTVKSGSFDSLKQMVAGLAGDRRIQALLIAFSFGAFIEGAAGFGTPVAISAAMLIGLGFRPLQAAGMALIGNTAPVAYGALGTPLIALAGVTGLPLEQLSAMVGRILPVFSVIVPFWLVWAMAGRKSMLQVWPACLTSGATFAVTQYFVSNHHGPWVVDIAGAMVSMAALVILLRFWQPRQKWTFSHETEADAATALGPASGGHWATKAWMPWMLLSILVFAWGLPPVKNFLNGLSQGTWHVPMLDKAVMRVPPVVPRPVAEPAVFLFNWLSATGTSLLVATIISGLLLGFSPAALVVMFWGTLKRMRLSLLTIAAMMAIGFTTRYAGLDATMGLAFASTGVLFPFFSPLLGWLGVALTGSDTASNVLFGGLQQITARQLGVSPVLAASANSAGGVMGKMIDAQSIVVAGVATRQMGQEGSILRYVFLHSIALAALVGVVVLLEAYAFPWIIPAAK